MSSNKIIVTFKNRPNTTTLRSIINGLQLNIIPIESVQKYDFRAVMLKGRIELTSHYIKQNEKRKLISCLNDAEQMNHMFRE